MGNEVRDFYNNYGIREWNRLDESIYSRINYLLHLDFINENIRPGMKILDAGCGAGRYSIEFAKRGCKVTLFDISDEQLRIAEEKIAEFNRVLKNRGILAVSVNNKWGILKMLLGNQYPEFFNNPEYWYIDQVMKTGDLPRHEKVNHPPRHFFEGAELSKLLEDKGFKDIILGGSPCFCCGNAASVEELGKDEKALKTIIEIELATYTKATMVDNGEFLLAKGIKPGD